jgi:hypothetical protein
MLLAWRGGDEAALTRLIPLVEQELHRIAQRYMAVERPGHGFQATALVNEAYLRLINVQKMDWQNRAHRGPDGDCAQGSRPGDARLAIGEGMAGAGTVGRDTT